MKHSTSLPCSAGLIEVGVVVAGEFDEIDTQAMNRALGQLAAAVSRWQPEFEFRFPRLQRPELVGSGRVEPSLLLQQAVENRDLLHWDFAFILTAAELAGKYQPDCFAALSRPLDAAVLSLSLIDPLTAGVDADPETRTARIARRLCHLMAHALGHLTGLARRDQRHNLMFHPESAQQLDAMQDLESDQLQVQRQALVEIADQRLEEGAGARLSLLWFALKAIWINRKEIVQAIAAARPWQFPRRLSRLTIASVSTVAILFMTAEAWDLGLSLSLARLAVLVGLALILTTIYVVVGQQLLVRRNRRRSEQTIVTSVSALGIVGIGMAVTWAILCLLGLGIGWLLFGRELITGWAESAPELAEQGIGITMLRMSGFTAAVGLFIGALGASFEAQHHFRHIIFVDEEI